jgi:membrane protease YdiL (CAAX protease family)
MIMLNRDTLLVKSLLRFPNPEIGPIPPERCVDNRTRSMNSSAIKRLIDAGGVAIIYGTIFKFSNPSHSYPQNFYLNSQQQQTIRDLQSFKMNLVFEANEIIQNLSHVLSQELHSLHEKYTFDGITRPSSTNVIEQWARKYTGDHIPNLSTELHSDERIRSKMRVIAPKDLRKLYQPNFPTDSFPSVSIRQSVNFSLEQFYRLEMEVITQFSEEQRQVNDIIKSFQTRIFSEHEFGTFLAIFFALSQLLGCRAYLFLTKKFFETGARTTPLIQPSRPFSTPVTMLLLMSGIFIYSLDDDSTSTRHLPSQTPSGKHLPQRIYHLSPSPPLHKPCTDRTDPWKPWSVFVNMLLPPIVEGYVFRKMLLNTLLSSTSPLKAHFLVAVAATACYTGMSSEVSSIYEIKHSLSRIYDVHHPPEEVKRTHSISTLPLMIQFVQYMSGSVFVSITAHASILCLRQLFLHKRTDDVLFSPTHSAYYSHIVHLHSCFLFSLLRIWEWIGQSNKFLDPEDSFLPDILIKTLEISNDTETNKGPSSAPPPDLVPSETKHVTISMEDLLDLEVTLACQKVNHQRKRKPTMPPKFQEFQNMQLPTPPFSHRDESRYIYNYFLPNSQVGYHSFVIDSCRHHVERMAVADGKIDFDIAMKYLVICLPDDLSLQSNVDPSQGRQQFKRHVFYWDECATEEELLDLVQEINAHVLEKIFRSVDLFRVTRGAWMCMELQGQEILTKEEEQALLEEYLPDMESYISVLRQREWFSYTKVYGLTPHRLKSLIARRGREYPKLVELSENWEKYFQSDELREKIHEKGNPFRVYRQRPVEDHEIVEVSGG